MKDVLVTTGFPRSGNTFLNYSLQSLFYPQNKPNINFHTVIAMEKYLKIMVPFRNPIDAISSWNYYPSGHSLNEDIKYYVRFYKAALEAKNVIFADFDKFTTDLDYIKQLVSFNFGPVLFHETSINNIKASMKSENKFLNLPDDNRQILIDEIKSNLIKIPELQECIDLYNQIKGA